MTRMSTFMDFNSQSVSPARYRHTIPHQRTLLFVNIRKSLFPYDHLGYLACHQPCKADTLFLMLPCPHVKFFCENPAAQRVLSVSLLEPVVKLLGQEQGLFHLGILLDRAAEYKADGHDAAGHGSAKALGTPDSNGES